MSNAMIPIENQIHLIRGQKVMLASDLAGVYGVETRTLNQAVKRNAERFPADFMFQLTADEADNLKSQSVTSTPATDRKKPQAGILPQSRSCRDWCLLTL
jgi:hypothetical protein